MVCFFDMTSQSKAIKLGIYKFFEILFENDKEMYRGAVINIIERCDFAKQYSHFQAENKLHSNLSGECINYELTKCKKIGLLNNSRRGYWKITERGKKVFISANGDSEMFYNKYIRIWKDFYKTGVIGCNIEDDNVLFQNFRQHYIDIQNTESEIEYVHRTKLVEEYKRDPQIRQEALKKEKYKCFFDNNHITFPTSNCEVYMEGHHIIPVSRKESFTQDLDVVENILCLCPTCHRKIHLATSEIKQLMLEEIIDKTQISLCFNINLMQLKEIYLSNLQ